MSKIFSDDQAKCKNVIAEAKSKKKNKRKGEDLMRSFVNISERGGGDNEDELQELGSR